MFGRLQFGKGAETLITTTTSPSDFGALRAVPEPLESLGTEALSDVARAATLAQNLAAATRLQAAYHLVETFARIDRDCHGQSLPGDASPSGTSTEQTSTDESSGDEASTGIDSRPAHARLAPADRARDHLAAAMKLTTWHAGRLVTSGVQIHTRLPRLRKAVDRGMFPEQLAIDTACRLAGVPDSIIGPVESDVVSTLARALDGGHRPSRSALDAAVDGAVQQHDPQVARDAADAAAEQRTVRFRPGRDGMTSMWANLPAGDAEKLRRRIDAAARAAQNSGHRRTRDQLRADALVALGDPTTDDVADPLPDDDRPVNGNPWATDKPVRISVINSAALGLPNQVQFVTGAYASFDWLCEQLLSGGDAKVRFELIDPVPGVLDRPDAALKYFITPALAERIRLRDGTCRHPGCTVAAQDCDIDHAIAFDHHRPELGGPTAEWNLICLCRKHHREKTFGHCAYRPGPFGELTIITETNHQHRTLPTGPLAVARHQLLDHRWREHLDRLIAEDGLLANPPGIDRPPRPPRGDTTHTA